MWNVFSNLTNSSTRCEVGVAMIAMLPRKAVNIGIDSMAALKKGSAIIDHQCRKGEAVLRDKDGRMMLGGGISPLHRDTPWKESGSSPRMATFGNSSTRW